jgi:ABC-2 type transport system permease protein
MTVFAKLTLNELRISLREPLYVFFTVLFPILLIVILGNVSVMEEVVEGTDGLRVIDLYAGVVIGMSTAIIGFQGMPSVLATYRERGILRRLATTPVRPFMLLGAQVVMNLITVLVTAVLVFTVASLAFDVPLPQAPLTFLLAILLSCAGSFALGLLLAALSPSGKTANAIGTFLFFPLMFLAGLWAPREVMPGWVQQVGDYTPIAAGHELLTGSLTGQSPSLLSVTVLVGYLVVCGAAAVKLFRWE